MHPRSRVPGGEVASPAVRSTLGVTVVAPVAPAHHRNVLEGQFLPCPEVGASMPGGLALPSTCGSASPSRWPVSCHCGRRVGATDGAARSAGGERLRRGAGRRRPRLPPGRSPCSHRAGPSPCGPWSWGHRACSLQRRCKHTLNLGPHRNLGSCSAAACQTTGSPRANGVVHLRTAQFRRSKL